MSEDLKAELTSIDGVGDATAEKIIDKLDDHDSGGGEYLDKAVGAAWEGNDRQAAMYLRRYAGNE